MPPEPNVRTRSESPASPVHANVEQGELLLEAMTMALYVAVVLFAELTVLSREATDSTPQVLAVVWGTALGVALAHIFAFSVAAGRGSLSIHLTKTTQVACAQLAGASIVALSVCIPVLLAPKSIELETTEIFLAGLIGLSGYLVSRRAGRTRISSFAYSAVVVVAGVAVAILKNMLSGH